MNFGEIWGIKEIREIWEIMGIWNKTLIPLYHYSPYTFIPLKIILNNLIVFLTVAYFS